MLKNSSSIFGHHHHYCNEKEFVQPPGAIALPFRENDVTVPKNESAFLNGKSKRVKIFILFQSKKK